MSFPQNSNLHVDSVVQLKPITTFPFLCHLWHSICNLDWTVVLIPSKTSLWLWAACFFCIRMNIEWLLWSCQMTANPYGYCMLSPSNYGWNLYADILHRFWWIKKNSCICSCASFLDFKDQNTIILWMG